MSLLVLDHKWYCPVDLESMVIYFLNVSLDNNTIREQGFAVHVVCLGFEIVCNAS